MSTHLFNILCNWIWSTLKAFPLHIEVWGGSPGKALISFVLLELHFYLFGRMTEDKFWLRRLEFWHTFLKNEQSEPVVSGKQFPIFATSDKIWFLNEYWFEKLFHHCELESLPEIQDIFDRIGGHINEHDFLTFSSEIHQHLKNLHSSMKQYFTNDQCMMLQNQSYTCNRST